MELAEASSILAAWAGKQPLVRRLFIFGSRARGDCRSDSDLDVAVELDVAAADDADGCNEMGVWMMDCDNWEEELRTLVPFIVDLELYWGAQTPIIEQALHRSSIMIYEKGAAVRTATRLDLD